MPNTKERRTNSSKKSLEKILEERFESFLGSKDESGTDANQARVNLINSLIED